MRSRDFITCVTRMAAGVAGSSLILAASTALAQHPAHDQEIHQRFYSTWMWPDNRRLPCCDNTDCSPAESKFENGHWMARKLGDDHCSAHRVRIKEQRSGGASDAVTPV